MLNVIYRAELKKRRDTKSGQAAGTNTSVLHDFVVRDCCNDPTTHTIECTSGWGISPWEYPKSWRWYSFNKCFNCWLRKLSIQRIGFWWTSTKGTKRVINIQEEVLHLKKRKF